MGLRSVYPKQLQAWEERAQVIGSKLQVLREERKTQAKDDLSTEKTKIKGALEWYVLMHVLQHYP